MGRWLRHQLDPATAQALARWSARATGALKRERAQHGITQAELGRRIGLNQDGIKDMELHPELVPVERLFVALNALGLELVIRPADANNVDTNK